MLGIVYNEIGWRVGVVQGLSIVDGKCRFSRITIDTYYSDAIGQKELLISVGDETFSKGTLYSVDLTKYEVTNRSGVLTIKGDLHDHT